MNLGEISFMNPLRFPPQEFIPDGIAEKDPLMKDHLSW